MLVNLQHKSLRVTVSELCSRSAPNLLEALVKLLGEEEHLTFCRYLSGGGGNSVCWFCPDAAPQKAKCCYTRSLRGDKGGGHVERGAVPLVCAL